MVDIDIPAKFRRLLGNNVLALEDVSFKMEMYYFKGQIPNCCFRESNLFVLAKPIGLDSQFASIKLTRFQTYQQ